MRSSSVNPGDSILASQYDNLRLDAYGGSELLAHQQSSPGLTLKVESGVFYIGITRVVYAGGNSPSFAAPSTNPRIDILTMDSSGTLAITQGVEAGSPVAPAYPTNKLVLCEVYNRVGETSIKDADDSTNGYIYNDVRPLLAPAYIASLTQIASGLLIPAPASPAQGDIVYYNGSTWVSLPAGTSGNFLRTQGAGANPIWSLPSVAATVKDGTAQSVVNPALNTFTTVRTNSSITAMVANGRYRFSLNVRNGTGVTAATYKLILGGTTIYTSGSTGGNDMYYEIEVNSLNSTSSQYYIIKEYKAGVYNTGIVSTGSIALGSAFSLTLQVNTGGGSTGTYTSDFLYSTLEQ